MVRIILTSRLSNLLFEFKKKETKPSYYDRPIKELTDNHVQQLSVPLCPLFWCKLRVFCYHFIDVAETKKKTNHEMAMLKPVRWNVHKKQQVPDCLKTCSLKYYKILLFYINLVTE